MIVAVHQPNFFPWLGYFDKFFRSDCFIVLDDVQFPKKGGTWMNRVQIAREGRPHWITAPVDRGYSGLRLISEMRFAPERSWRDEVWRAIELAYSRAPCWSEAARLIEPLVYYECQSLMEYNLHAMKGFFGAFGIDSGRSRLASSLRVDSTGTQRLVQLTAAVGGSAYLCGSGSSGYIEPEIFDRAGIELRFQAFVPRPYLQTGGSDFVPGLSYVDALANIGVCGLTRHLMAER